MIKQNMRHFNRLIVLADASLLVLALFLSWYFRFESGLFSHLGDTLTIQQYMQPTGIIVPIYLAAYYLFGIYKPYRTKSVLDEWMNLTRANVVGFILFLGYLYIVRNVHYSRLLLAFFLVFSMGFAIGSRAVLRLGLRQLRRSGKNKKHVVLAGVGDLADEYANRIQTNLRWGYEIAGVFDDRMQGRTLKIGDGRGAVKVPWLGRFDQMETYLKDSGIDEVIITLPLSEYQYLKHVVNICEKTGVFTRIIPDYTSVIPTRAQVDDIDGLPIINIRNIPLNDVVLRIMKRTFDLMGAFFGLLAISPLLAVIAAAIRFSSPGPVLFRQTRVGYNRKNFEMYKFRTMRVQEVADEQKQWTTRDDPRVTPVGKWLRRLSFDELPQLVNVLRGEMSLVGPRPERPQFVEKFMEEIPKYMVKHMVRPGMTGWAQVHGYRGDTSIRRRIEYDLYYIENWSLLLDLKILIMTLFKGSVNQNAY